MQHEIGLKDIELKRGGGLDLSADSSGEDRVSTERLSSTTPLPSAAQQETCARGRKEGDRAQLRILLVEDHLDTALILGRLLCLSGYEVTTVHNSKDALLAAKEKPYDILVSDIGLPDGTGYEIMRQIRELYPIPGVALSGYGMEEDVRRSRDAGFSDHIVKPVNFTHLQQIIERISPR